MTNKEIMAEPLRLLKAFREALGKARLEIREKASADLAKDSSSKAFDKIYEQGDDLKDVHGFLEIAVRKLANVRDNGPRWLDYNEEGEK